MTNQILSPIIKAEELALLIAQNNIQLIDARVGKNIKNVFAQQHLKGALYVDLDRDLADIKPNAADGGRHPLPDIHKFAQFLGSLGIEPTTHIVVYDDKNGANAAARFWWMLKALGHDKIQVLDGGFAAAIAHNLPLSTDIKTPDFKQTYPVTTWLLPTANMEEVAEVAQNPHFVVIDVRDVERYRGEKEPIDLIAGHIPGAINVPLTLNLDAKGSFLPQETLKKQYDFVINNRKPHEIIVHCGSGVTACHTILAMAYAGFEIPKLYVGSWSEWSRNDKEIGTYLL